MQRRAKLLWNRAGLVNTIMGKRTAKPALQSMQEGVIFDNTNEVKLQQARHCLAD